MPLPTLLTADQFIDWPGDGVNRLHQLIDGEPVAMTPPSWRHNAIAFELGRRLGNLLEEWGSHCVVVPEPGIQPRAGTSVNIRVPDLAVSCNPGNSHWLEQPVLIVEVLSPSNIRETREAVRAYLSIPSVREILVIDSRTIRPEMLRRETDATWPAELTIWTEGEDSVLESLEFRCALSQVYPAPS